MHTKYTQAFTHSERRRQRQKRDRDRKRQGEREKEGAGGRGSYNSEMIRIYFIFLNNCEFKAFFFRKKLEIFFCR